jgi:hypothetical protein
MMTGEHTVRKGTQRKRSLGNGLKISPMMSLGMPSSVVSSPRGHRASVVLNPDYEIIAVRSLGCHFYEVIKDHQLTLKTMV